MEVNPSEPSSTCNSPPRTVAEVVWPPHTHYSEVEYTTTEPNVAHYDQKQYIHFKPHERATLTVSDYQESAAQFDPRSSGSNENYGQVSLHTYRVLNGTLSNNDTEYENSPVTHENNSKDQTDHSDNKSIPVSCDHSTEVSPAHTADGIIGLQNESADSSHVNSPESSLERVAMDSMTLQQAVSAAQQSVGGLSLSVVLDRSGIAAFMATSHADALVLENAGIHKPVITSQALSQRALLNNDQSQFLTSDGSVATIGHGLLSPVLAQRDILHSIIPSSTTSSINHITSSFPINHKHMLAQKYAAELETPATSASLISGGREQQDHLIDSNRISSPYVVASGGGAIIDSQTMSVYGEHTTSIVASAVQSLPIDVYSIDRGVALVTSTRDSPDDILENAQHFTPAVSSQPIVHSFVSSSVDLVPSDHDPSMHCTADSTVGPNLHTQEEHVVDSSDGYGHQVDTTEDGLHTTSRGYSHHMNNLISCDDASSTSSVAVLNGASVLDANEALSTSSHLLPNAIQLSRTSNGSVDHNLDDLHDCTTVSSATHPDSTHSPLGLCNKEFLQDSASSNIGNLTRSSRPRRDLRSGHHWCEDCSQFYEKECPLHKIQLIFDKPVLTRAWASLPATYLYVNKIGLKQNGETVYGVFAKKTIPKRTQFGPIEGVLVKREDQMNDIFTLLIEHEGGSVSVMDTSDESMSNWMRFVRPADTFKEQNIVLVQQGQFLYFNTTRSINPKTELRVWYSTAYAAKWKLPLLEVDEEEKRVLEELKNAWPCFECNQRFCTSEDLQKHLNQHDESEEVEERPGPRTRNRVRGRGRPPKKSHNLKLQAALETVKEISETLRKPRGRPPKKYKVITSKDDYKCEICHKVFPRNYSLQRHLIMHSGEKKFKCPICDMKFSHVYNRNRHVRRHRQRGENEPISRPIKSLFKKKQGAEWVCTHCDLTFDNSNVLNLHTLTHAAEDVGLTDSTQRDVIYYMTDTFIDVGERSDDNSKEGEIETFKCPECTQEFEIKRDLIEHASVHGKIIKQRSYRGVINPLKPYKCNLCYKSFASDERLIRHYLVHGSEDSKPLQCDICFKRFLNNSALACHIKVHSEEKKFYECPICKKEFDQIVALKEHVHIHCIGGVYNCPHCQKTFEEYNQIRKHIRAFHSERRYPCDKCDKVFPRPDKLKLHMLRHSDHREFLCANCGKQFKRKDKLKEHMKRMHAPEREARINARTSKPPGSKKFVPKVSPTDYHRFIYKCHSCLLGFKRRGMLVNHLAKRHPDIRPESVPELNLPILKTTRDYYCQYCDKVYKSSSKRKAHILKNHPGAELPMSNRRKGGVPEIPGMPNPTFSQTVGSITTHPHHCGWCHKQYASKAKLLQHQRKKHMDMLALTYVTSSAKLHSVSEQAPTVTGPIVITQNVANMTGDTAVVIDARRKIHYVDRDSLVVSSHPDGIPSADLLTQAMSELTQTLSEYRASPGEYLNARLTHSAPNAMMPPSPSSSPPTQHPTPTHTPTPPGHSSRPTPTSTPGLITASQPNTTSITAIDQNQLNQLLAQYHQPPLSPQSLAVAAASINSTNFAGRSWPATVATTMSNYPAR